MASVSMSIRRSDSSTPSCTIPAMSSIWCKCSIGPCVPISSSAQLRARPTRPLTGPRLPYVDFDGRMGMDWAPRSGAMRSFCKVPNSMQSAIWPPPALASTASMAMKGLCASFSALWMTSSKAMALGAARLEDAPFEFTAEPVIRALQPRSSSSFRPGCVITAKALFVFEFDEDLSKSNTITTTPSPLTKPSPDSSQIRVRPLFEITPVAHCKIVSNGLAIQWQEPTKA
mmetsp:Transcript_116813/g.371798  ORF Transcript_116813/g.371798 Transcript_116813/m.371798 type:complete len:229 (-) Transcript_116813:1579-2265(-)